MDLILHAGDATSADVLDRLAQLAPVHAVAGNLDGPAVRAWGAAEEARLEVGGVPVAMVHDAGRRQGRARRLQRRFPQVRMVVFGHSHIPLDEQSPELRLVNPGSPTWKRLAPRPTFALADIDRERLDVWIVEL